MYFVQQPFNDLHFTDEEIDIFVSSTIGIRFRWFLLSDVLPRFWYEGAEKNLSFIV